MTVPGAAVIITDAIARYQRGQLIQGYIPQWDGSMDLGVSLDQFQKMDRIERLEWASEMRPKVAEYLAKRKQEMEAAEGGSGETQKKPSQANPDPAGE